MHIQCVKYYKLLVHVSSPLCFGEWEDNTKELTHTWRSKFINYTQCIKISISIYRPNGMNIILWHIHSIVYDVCRTVVDILISNVDSLINSGSNPCHVLWYAQCRTLRLLHHNTLHRLDPFWIKVSPCNGCRFLTVVYIVNKDIKEFLAWSMLTA
jgi:hypothetical protein